MDFIKISPTTNFKLNRFWIRIELHFKFMCHLAYSLEFDLRLRSGQVCITYQAYSIFHLAVVLIVPLLDRVLSARSAEAIRMVIFD